MSLNRRSFLKKAPVVAAPFILPSHIWSAETKPNDRITIGMIGTGRQAKGLLSGFMGNGCQVLAVCDVDKTRREHYLDLVKQRHESKPTESGSFDCVATNNFEEITSRDDIDAVCIATPDHWHAIPTIEALKTGKDVYCEKPLTHNIHEAVTVINAVDKYKRVLQTGSMQRSSKEFRIACELVRNGVIGKVDRVEVQFRDPGRPCDLPEEEMEPGLDWDRWVGPSPMRPYNSILSPRGMHKHFPNWRTYKEFGGGMVCDWGAHHIDIAQWGLGRDASGPVAVTPPAKKGDKRGAVLTYDDGVTVTHGDGFGVHFFGTDGEVKVNRGKFELIRNGETFQKFTKREDGGSLASALVLSEREFLKDKKVSLYASKGHVPDFLNSMRTREKPITHEGVGGRSAICCHLMNQAYYNHAAFTWDPDAFMFTKGSGDAKWLTREYRGKWKV